MIYFKKLSYKISNFLSHFKFRGLNWGSLFWSFFFILIIVGLSFNIYTAFSKGVDTINKFQEEQKKLQDLKDENQRLQNEVSHYESIEYKKIYARDNLNLGEKGETLYYVDRPEEVVEIEGLEEQKIEISLNDNISYWKKLILGL